MLREMLEVNKLLTEEMYSNPDHTSLAEQGVVSSFVFSC